MNRMKSAMVLLLHLIAGDLTPIAHAAKPKGGSSWLYQRKKILGTHLLDDTSAFSYGD